MSNEIKIGLLAIVALGLMFWGYKFVEGQDIFNRTKAFMVEYDNVGGLTEGTNVMRSGVQVGIVTEVYLNPENLETVLVKLDLEKDLPLPKNTIAAIATTDFLGDKNVELIFDGPCSGADCAESGDFLLPGTKSVLSSMTGGPEAVGEYVEQVTSRVNVLVDSLGQSTIDPNSTIGQITSDIDEILKNLKQVTANANAIVTNNSRKISELVDGLNSIAVAIKNRDEELDRILVNADTLMQNLAKVDLDGTLNTAEDAIGSLNTTLSSADKAVEDLQTILTAIKQGEGTLGQLVTNDDLYDQLNETMRSIDLLLEDVRLNPARYTTFLKKKRPEYEKPANTKNSENSQESTGN